MHLVNLGRFLASVNCYGLTSIEAVILQGKKIIENNHFDHDELVLGMVWNNDYFTDCNYLINRHDLDKVSKDLPVVFRRACGHVVSCNTKALQLLNINEATKQVDG